MVSSAGHPDASAPSFSSVVVLSLPPEFPDFPSRPTPDGSGRVYRVWESTHLVAYAIPDGITLRKAGAREGFVLYAFLEGKRVGYWNWSYDPEDLRRVMAEFRAVFDPSAPRPPRPPAPGGEEPTIRGLFSRQVGSTLRNAPLPPDLYLDVSGMLEDEPEPPEPKVTRLRRRESPPDP